MGGQQSVPNTGKPNQARAPPTELEEARRETRLGTLEEILLDSMQQIDQHPSGYHLVLNVPLPNFTPNSNHNDGAAPKSIWEWLNTPTRQAMEWMHRWGFPQVTEETAHIALLCIWASGCHLDYDFLAGER